MVQKARAEGFEILQMLVNPGVTVASEELTDCVQQLAGQKELQEVVAGGSPGITSRLTAWELSGTLVPPLFSFSIARMKNVSYW